MEQSKQDVAKLEKENSNLNQKILESYELMTQLEREN